MQAALRRKRDNRPPADSGEYLPVPIRYITLGRPRVQARRQAGKAWAWIPLAVVQASIQAVAVPLSFVVGVALVENTPFPLGIPVALAVLFTIPPATAGLAAALTGLLSIFLRVDWPNVYGKTVLAGVLLWALLVPAWLIVCQNASRPLRVLELTVAGVPLGLLFAAWSFPGAVAGASKVAAMAGRAAERRSIKARAKYYLTRGWRAP